MHYVTWRGLFPEFALEGPNLVRHGGAHGGRKLYFNGDQFGRLLDLIENNGHRDGSQEATRIDRCGLADVWRLERDIVGCATEDALQQRSLTGLPRAGEDHGRELPRSPLEHRFAPLASSVGEPLWDVDAGCR